MIQDLGLENGRRDKMLSYVQSGYMSSACSINTLCNGKGCRTTKNALPSAMLLRLSVGGPHNSCNGSDFCLRQLIMLMVSAFILWSMS